MTRIFLIYVSFFVLLICNGCTTGIEGTKTIKMSKSERREMAPTDEETLSAKFVSRPVAEWTIGKKFYVSDNKIQYLLENAGHDLSFDMKGHILEYIGYESKASAGDSKTLQIRFKDLQDNKHYLYNTGREIAGALKSLRGTDLPALIDMELIEKVNTELAERQLWILTQLWYDKSQNPVKGKKFVPVRLIKAIPGDMNFPILLEMSDEDNNSFYLFMNVMNGSSVVGESRTFPSIFSLGDPRNRYPAIQDEIWTNIQNGNISLGMTKEECRLSLGNPDDVDSGHNWNNTIDIWRYKNGTFLQFEDGLLVNFRK